MYVMEYGWGGSLEAPSVPCLKTYTGTIRRKRRSVSVAHVRTYKMTEGGLEHSGYIDIKQPPKIKGRKLKSWKKKWVVVNEMSIRAAGRSAVKVDVYADKNTAVSSPADKLTFILEFVTDVRAAKSKNRFHAFEVVEQEPVLLLAGSTELETQTWISVFRKIFFPDEKAVDEFPVVIVSNEHASRLGLVGTYKMSVNPEEIAVRSKDGNAYEWSLNMLKRFHLEKDTENPTLEILTIECGPKSACGEATFQFRSDHVTFILAAIKKNIFIALSQRKSERASKTNTPQPEKRIRTSVSSDASSSEIRMRSETTCSIEQRYKDLLENATDREAASGRGQFSMQVSKESTESFAESIASDKAPELPPKKRPNVTFEISPPEMSEPVKEDLLSSPVEVLEEDDGESQYNRVEFHPKNTPKTSTIISMFTVAKPGYETKVLLDDRGYSHVDIQNSKPVVCEEKIRSLSNMSSQSTLSCRTASVGSKDSGVEYAKVDKSSLALRENQSIRSSNSFDSAVSTSSAVGSTVSNTIDSGTTHLTVEVQAVEVTGAELIENEKLEGVTRLNDVTDAAIYQDVSLEEDKCENKSEQGNEKVYAKPKLRKSSSTGAFATERSKENEYEDLDNFRKGKKNLVKHLGMDPQVDPKSVPPSLPERPTSHKMKRKFYNAERKRFTLPFRTKGRKQKERAMSISSSSTDSDSESTRGSKKSDDIAVKVWPLGNKSVTVGNEDLYQPIAIERYLKDNDGMAVPQKRERSSSLNLNMASSSKRTSTTSEAAERRNMVWKHNRNVSMQMDMLNRMNDPNNTMLEASLQENFDLSLQPEMLLRTNERTAVEMGSDNDSVGVNSDDEPIYAEVEPVKKDSNQIENPFPNLTFWKPQDISDVAEVSELNDTKYENDDSMVSLNKTERGDMLNQGFVMEDEAKCDCDNLLIDLSCSEPSKTLPVSKSGIDIFNISSRPVFLDSSLLIPTRSQPQPVNITTDFIDIFSLGCGDPLQTSTSDILNQSVIAPDSTQAVTDLLTTEQNTESIYMDMTSSNNESIYVLPSSLQR